MLGDLASIYFSSRSVLFYFLPFRNFFVSFQKKFNFVPPTNVPFFLEWKFATYLVFIHYSIYSTYVSRLFKNSHSVFLNRKQYTFSILS